MKRTIKLTENELHKVIEESVRNILNENVDYSAVWRIIDELRTVMSDEDIIARLISRIGPFEAQKILENIRDMEVPTEDEEMEVE